MNEHEQHAYYSRAAEVQVLPTVQVHRETGERVAFWCRTKEWAEKNIRWKDLEYLGVRDTRDYETVPTGNPMLWSPDFDEDWENDYDLH